MKLFAISDLHLANEANRAALDALPYFPDDWLIIAGDVGETVAHLRFALERVTARFARVLWVPGNHDLWTLPAPSNNEVAPSQDQLVRGVSRYNLLVDVCRAYGVLTPEDPFPLWQGTAGPLILAPLFLLYDYTFCPDSLTTEADALAWAAEANLVCSDEYLLHPDPYPTRSAWCAARYTYSEQRLQAAMTLHPHTSFVLINHYPLHSSLARLPRIPRFSIWCGTKRTEQWHLRFPTAAVIYGHLHIRSTHYLDGVRCEEVSLGYPRDWDQQKSMQHYLRQLFP